MQNTAIINRGVIQYSRLELFACRVYVVHKLRGQLENSEGFPRGLTLSSTSLFQPVLAELVECSGRFCDSAGHPGAPTFRGKNHLPSELQTQDYGEWHSTDEAGSTSCSQW